MAMLALFLAGAFLCNGVPHLVSGLKGEAFFTPWARPRGIGKSSALENFLWGAANLLVGAVLLGRNLAGTPLQWAALASGALLMGAGLSILFSRRRAAARGGVADRGEAS